MIFSSRRVKRGCHKTGESIRSNRVHAVLQVPRPKPELLD